MRIAICNGGLDQISFLRRTSASLVLAVLPPSVTCELAMSFACEKDPLHENTKRTFRTLGQMLGGSATVGNNLRSRERTVLCRE
jgi:hypothetical protein